MQPSEVQMAPLQPPEPIARVRAPRIVAAILQISGLAFIAAGLRAPLPLPIFSTLVGIALLVIGNCVLPRPPRKRR